MAYYGTQARPLRGDHRAGRRRSRSTSSSSAHRARRALRPRPGRAPPWPAKLLEYDAATRAADDGVRSWRRCCSTTPTSSTQAGLVTNYAVESRLADRVGDCFTQRRGHPVRRVRAGDGRDHPRLQQGGVRAVPAVACCCLRMPELAERLTAGGTILELGCGAGAGLVSLARTFPACTVTGRRPGRRRRSSWRAQRIEAAGLGEHVHAEEMRGEDLTSEDAFDFIYAQISLHEMDDARIVLANARRALKDDGILLVTEIRGRGAASRTASAPTTRCCRTSTCSTRSRRRSRRAATPSASSRARSSRRWRRAPASRGVRELHLDQPLYAAFVAYK